LRGFLEPIEHGRYAMSFSGLVLDLDRTLLYDEEKTLATKSRQALKGLIAKNIPVVIATGRSWFRTEPVVESLRLIDPVITLLGSQICHPASKKQLYLRYLRAQDVRQLITWSRMHSMIPYLVTIEGTIPTNPDADLIFQEHEPALPYVETLPVEHALQLLLLPLEVAGSLQKDFLRLQGMLLQTTEQLELECQFIVGHRYITCVNGSTDKGAALRFLSQQLNWDLSRFIAVGDSFLDLSLFDEVGYPVVVGNRHPELVALARKVLPADSPEALGQLIQECFP
jgi:Cof subfamily protein (haloacid dehalogenase superfamily)